MKLLLILIFLAALPASAANRFFLAVAGSCGGNWSDTDCWSTTSGGAGGSVVPTASDDVHFDAVSGSCTVDASSRVALTLDFTGYTNTITMSQQITVSGSVTLVSAMTIAGSGALIVNAATATLTSNTEVWPNALTLIGTATYTIADNWTVAGLLTLGQTTNTTTVNGSQITAQAGLTASGTSGIVTGSTVILMAGTGTITGQTTTGSLRNPLTINTAGTITFAAAPFNYDTGTLTYTSGTISGASAVTLTAKLSTTFACAGITWGALSVTGATTTLTLNEDLNVSGLTTLGSTTNTITINGNELNTGGGLRYNGTSGVVSGTTVIVLTGAGTVDAPSWTSGRITNPITIAAGGGTVNVDATSMIDFGKLLYTSGTVTTDSGTWASGGGGGQKGYSWIQ